ILVLDKLRLHVRNLADFDGGRAVYQLGRCLQVLYEDAVGGLLPEDESGMDGEQNRPPVDLLHRAPELRDGLLFAEKCLHGHPAHRHDDLRVYTLDLRPPALVARRDFLRGRCAVVLGVAADRVRVVYVFGLNARLPHGLCEKLTGPADEGTAKLYLVLARRFAHDHDVSPALAVTRHAWLVCERAGIAF